MTLRRFGARPRRCCRVYIPDLRRALAATPWRRGRHRGRPALSAALARAYRGTHRAPRGVPHRRGGCHPVRYGERADLIRPPACAPPSTGSARLVSTLVQAWSRLPFPAWPRGGTAGAASVLHHAQTSTPRLRLLGTVWADDPDVDTTHPNNTTEGVYLQVEGPVEHGCENVHVHRNVFFNHASRATTASRRFRASWRQLRLRAG